MVPLRRVPDAVFIDESDTYVNVRPRLQIAEGVMPRRIAGQGDFGLVVWRLNGLAEYVGAVLHDSMSYWDIAVPLRLSVVGRDFNCKMFRRSIDDLYWVSTVR